MTIICAAQWGGQTVIGCDSAGTDGWGAQRDYGEKLMEFPWGWLGFTASYRVPQAIQYDLKKVGSVTPYNILEVVNAIQDGLRRSGWTGTHASDLPKCDGLGLLLATPEGLFTVDENLAILSLGAYAAVGSGYQVALGALHYASEEARRSCRITPDTEDPPPAPFKGKPTAHEGVERAILAATNLISSCGGQHHFRTVSP